LFFAVILSEAKDPRISLAEPQHYSQASGLPPPRYAFRMALNRSARAAGITLLVVAAFVCWWAVASNYDYGALSGTYTFSGDGESSTLVLKPDRTFQQELRHDGKVDHATGTWRRMGEGGVNFSLGFLPISGAKQFREEFPDHLDGTPEDDEYYGHFEKVLGVYPILKLNANPPGPTLHRRLFH